MKKMTAEEWSELEPMNKESAEEEDKKKPQGLFPSCRLAMSVLSFTGLFMTAQSQGNLGAAIVCMVNNGSGNDTETFDWDKKTQGWILSVRFFAYYLAQLPSGHLTAYISSRMMATVGLLVLGMADILTVPSAGHSVTMLLLVRIVQGVANAMVTVSCYNMVGKWFPKHESSLLNGFVGTGFFAGTFLVFGFSAVVCEDPNLGWAYIFYFSGGVSLLYTAVWYIFADDDPSVSRWVGEEEKDYIMASKRDEIFCGKVPWTAMAKSGSMYAIAFGQIAGDWLVYLTITVAPSYFTDILHLSEGATSMVCGVPYMLVIAVSMLFGRCLDVLRERHCLSTLGARRLAQAVGNLSPAACCLLLALFPAWDIPPAVLVYVLCVLAFCGNASGWIANIADLAPHLTGAVFTFCQTLALWTSFVVPVLVDYLTAQKTKEQWNIVFYITAGIQLVCYVGFYILSSGEVQPWARSEGSYLGAYKPVPGFD